MTDPQTLRAQADEILERHEQGRLEEALAGCDRLLSAVEDADLVDEVVRESVFTARFERAVLHAERDELDAAAEAFATAAATPTDPDDPDQRHELAMALCNQGICLDAAGRASDALAVYEQLLQRLGDAGDPVTADQVLRARVNRAAALAQLGRHEDALAAADEVAAGLDAADALEAEQLARCLRLRAASLAALDRLDDALAALEGVTACALEEPVARAQVVAAAGDRVRLLQRAGRAEEARSLAETTRQRFGGDEDEEVREALDGLPA